MWELTVCASRAAVALWRHRVEGFGVGAARCTVWQSMTTATTTQWIVEQQTVSVFPYPTHTYPCVELFFPVVCQLIPNIIFSSVLLIYGDVLTHEHIHAGTYEHMNTDTDRMCSAWPYIRTLKVWKTAFTHSVTGCTRSYTQTYKNEQTSCREKNSEKNWTKNACGTVQQLLQSEKNICDT